MNIISYRTSLPIEWTTPCRATFSLFGEPTYGELLMQRMSFELREICTFVDSKETLEKICCLANRSLSQDVARAHERQNNPLWRLLDAILSFLGIARTPEALLEAYLQRELDEGFCFGLSAVLRQSDTPLTPELINALKKDPESHKKICLIQLLQDLACSLPNEGEGLHLKKELFSQIVDLTGPLPLIHDRLGEEKGTLQAMILRGEGKRALLEIFPPGGGAGHSMLLSMEGKTPAFFDCNLPQLITSDDREEFADKVAAHLLSTYPNILVKNAEIFLVPKTEIQATAYSIRDDTPPR